MQEYIACLKKYAVFRGRSSRREYWVFSLISCTINLILSCLSLISIPAVSPKVAGETFLYYSEVPLTFFGISLYSFWPYELAIFLPSIAVEVRRFHDIGRSGLWVLIPLVPFVFLLMDLMLVLLGYLDDFVIKSSFAENCLLALSYLLWILLVFLLLKRGQKGDNKYGPEPA